MKIRNSVENAPILSGVAETGEFRIRNSAKAFGILSSGLYANKIRAIIREYSCNAVDSHIEAGKADVPFDVHLPSSLEPWFAVRDYGVGLDDDQVKNIFTTYFESTKSGTDDLIGGLGLGSKSAFSYTENFTITAIKNGMKRVFTAFISDTGVPSIALMGQEESNEPTGVEIRFAVEDEYDFYKFEREAQHVYKHFKLRPVVSSGNTFEFVDPQYEQMDLVPGIHLLSRARGSYAIMGNIEYPLDVPAGVQSGDELFGLLGCGLEIHFGIGELDIQASREGLSYIPETIAAIRARLVELNDSLEGILKQELAQYKSVWEIFPVLERKANSPLWSATVKNYVKNTYPNDFNVTYYGVSAKSKSVDVDVLKNKYNIKISGFTVYPGYDSATASTITENHRWDYAVNGYVIAWDFLVNSRTKFVVTDTKVGALNRAKHHWKKDAHNLRDDQVYVLSAVDKNKPMKLDALWKALKNPPKSQIFKASELDEVVRQSRVQKNASILKMCPTTKGWQEKIVWRAAGNLSAFDDNTTYYYVPLKGYESLGKVKHMRSLTKALMDSGIYTGNIYGVRKSDVEAVEERSNWVLLDDFIEGKLTDPNLINDMGVVKNAIDYANFYKFKYDFKSLVDADSPFFDVAKVFEDVEDIKVHKSQATQTVLKLYGIEPDQNATVALTEKYRAEIVALHERYPLIRELSAWIKPELVAEYINMVDKVKGA